MKILFISHKYPPSIGGMEKHAFELRTRLEQQHEIIPLIYDNQAGRFTFFRLLEKNIKQLLAVHQGIDLIYVNEGLLACFVARIKRWTKIPIVATVHGLDVVFPNFFYQAFLKKQLQKLDGLIAVSQATGEACRKRGIAAHKIFVVKNGVDHELGSVEIDPDFLANFEKQQGIRLKDKKILVTMGRPVRRKGFSWFVQNVMPQLSSDTILLLIGPRKGKERLFFKYLPSFIKRQLELAFSMSSDETNLRAAINLTANKNRVFELGKLPFSAVLQLLKAAEIFIMPNKKVEGDMEGFGLVALEASISNTPVVAAGIEGIKDAVQDGKNGYLLPPEEPQVWGEQLTTILKDQLKLDEFSKKGKAYTLKEFSWEKMANGYEGVFEQVTALRSIGIA